MANLRKYINNYQTTLDGAVLVADTVITLTDVADLPVITGSEFYELTIVDDLVTPTQIEIVKVTSRSGNDITVVRAQGGTLAFDFDDLAPVRMNATADSYERLAEGDQSVNQADSPTFADATINSQLFSEFKDIQNSNLRTGLVSGGVTSIGTDTAKFDLSAGTGIHVDNYTDPENPVITQVSWNAFDEVTTTFLATAETSIVAIDINGDIVQLENDFSVEDTRDYIILTIMLHTDNTVIAQVSNRPVLAIQGDGSLIDLCTAVGLINTSGNVYSANGANVKFDKTSGSTFGCAANWETNQKLPNNTTDASAAAIVFVPVHRDGAGDFTGLTPTDDVDTGFYDDGTGTLAAIPNNKFVVHRVSFNPAVGLNLLEYAQEVYDTQGGAELAIPTQAFVSDPPILATTTLRLLLIVKKGTTDLTNTSEAKFIAGPKSRLSQGGVGGSGAGGGSADASLDNLSGVAINESLISDTDSTDSLGSTGIRWANLWVDDVTITNNIDIGNYAQMSEISLPSNPAADFGRIYLRDVAGTTTLFFLDSAGTETSLLAGGGGGDPDQNLWFTMTADSGTTNASTTTDTFTLTGGAGISTAISGDVITFTIDTASTTLAGIAELATTAEVSTGTDTGRVITPSSLPVQIQDSKYTYAADAEASDTYVIALTPAPASYAIGQVFYFKANTANTGGATLNVNALGAVSILKNHDVALDDNDIESGSLVSVMYDGTNFQMLSQIANAAGGGGGDHVITTGTNAPVSTPVNIGDHYVDTNNNTHWFAHGTSASSDWRQVVQESDFNANTGFIVKTSDVFPAAYNSRTFSNDDGTISITNGDGVSGDPVLGSTPQNATTITAVDITADWLSIWDTSAGAIRKVNPEDVGFTGLTVFKVSDESATSDTTLSDDAELTLPVEANTIYLLDAHLRTLSASSVPDIKVALSLPSGATAHWSFAFTNIEQDETSAQVNALTASQEEYCNPQGILTIGGTSGNAVIQWAQDVSSATATTVQGGSSLRLTKIG
jgi:hypothetical protein